MYAVIKTGGKQYRVAANDVISIEKLPGEAGERVMFDEVLLVGNGDDSSIGNPVVGGASVAGEVVEQTRGRKIIVFKKKRRKNYRRTKGHRQHLTLVRITEILTDGAKPSAKQAAKKPAKKAEEDAAAQGKDKAEKPKDAEAKADAAAAKKAPAKPATSKDSKDASKAKEDTKAKPGAAAEHAEAQSAEAAPEAPAAEATTTKDDASPSDEAKKD
jgi:large subunit ribosomal protein L21